MGQSTEDIKKSVSELATLRDEIKLKIHLAGMEAKTLFTEVSKEIEEITTEKARIVTHQTIEAVKDRLTKIQASLKSS